LLRKQQKTLGATYFAASCTKFCSNAFFLNFTFACVRNHIYTFYRFHVKNVNVKNTPVHKPQL